MPECGRAPGHSVFIMRACIRRLYRRFAFRFHATMPHYEAPQSASRAAGRVSGAPNNTARNKLAAAILGHVSKREAPKVQNAQRTRTLGDRNALMHSKTISALRFSLSWYDAALRPKSASRAAGRVSEAHTARNKLAAAIFRAREQTRGPKSAKCPTAQCALWRSLVTGGGIKKVI